jgi:hypothetical protein
MREATFEVRVPADLLEFGFGQDQIQRHVTEWPVLSLFTDGGSLAGKTGTLPARQDGGRAGVHRDAWPPQASLIAPYFLIMRRGTATDE